MRSGLPADVTADGWRPTAGTPARPAARPPPRR